MDDTISNIYYNDSPTRRKKYEEFILKTIEKDSIIKIYIKSSELRRHFHKWASSNNLFHVSYCDKVMNFETRTSYWCKTCERYIKKKDYEIQPCCGDGECGECLILCNLCADDDDVTIIADESGAYDDVPAKETKQTNNIIVISNKIELLSDIFEKKHIKKPLEWMNKREKKFF
jgi:hypothetical protein